MSELDNEFKRAFTAMSSIMTMSETPIAENEEEWLIAYKMILHRQSLIQKSYRGDKNSDVNKKY